MKIIDLLVELEKGTIPNKAKFKWKDSIITNKNGTLYCNDKFFSKILNFGCDLALSDEIEIIEDKPIEKILLNYQDGHSQEAINEYLRCKINEIIKEVNKLKKESDK